MKEVQVQTTALLHENYSSIALSELVEGLEQRYQVVDEVEYFKPLVNMSTTYNKPFEKWIKYREGYASELVRELIRRSNLKPREDIIVDPMCGVGATLNAARSMGFDSWGGDVNPFVVDVTNAKIKNYSKQNLSDVLNFCKKLSPQKSIKVNVDNATYVSYSKYFSDRNLIALEDLYNQISNIRKEKIKSLLLATWLCIVEDCSNRKKDGNGLVTRESKVTDVYQCFSEAVLDFIADINGSAQATSNGVSEVSSATENRARIRDFCKNQNKKVGAIIFSPPYANSFNYFESHKMELLIGKYFTIKELPERRKKLVRNYRISGKTQESSYRTVELLIEELMDAIPLKEARTGKKDARSRLVPNMLRGYFQDMGSVLKESFSVLKKNGLMYIVVDQSSYAGVVIPTDVMLAELAENVGFKVDHIINCRRANTSAQQLKSYPYLREVLREGIVVLRK